MEIMAFLSLATSLFYVFGYFYGEVFSFATKIYIQNESEFCVVAGHNVPCQRHIATISTNALPAITGPAPRSTERMSAIEIADMDILNLEGYEWNPPLVNDELSPNNETMLDLPPFIQNGHNELCPHIPECCVELPFRSKRGNFIAPRCKQK